MLHLASLFSVLEFFAHSSLKFLIAFDKSGLTHEKKNYRFFLKVSQSYAM